MRDILRNWKTLVVSALWAMFGIPCYQEYGSSIWDSMLGMIPRDFQIVSLTVGVMLFLLWAGFTIEAHWPTIVRWLRIARTWWYKDELGVMHFGTIHGELSVRLDDKGNTIEDIQHWLTTNKLTASVSGPGFMGVVKRASENRRKKRKK